MVLLVGTPQNLQKVLSNFLSFFWNFGHIWKLLEIYRTFSGGSANLLYFFESSDIISCFQNMLKIKFISLIEYVPLRKIIYYFKYFSRVEVENSVRLEKLFSTIQLFNFRVFNYSTFEYSTFEY